MSTTYANFFGVQVTFPIITTMLFQPAPGTSETAILSISCSPADQVASLSGISGIVGPPYYGWLFSFNILQSIFTPSLYFIMYWPQSSYNPCLQLPFTNIYLVNGGKLYIFFAFTFGT